MDLVDAEKDLSDFDGLIMLDIFSSSDKPSIIDHVDLIKKLDFDRAKWVYLISDVPAHLQEINDAAHYAITRDIRDFSKVWQENLIRRLAD